MKLQLLAGGLLLALLGGSAYALSEFRQQRQVLQGRLVAADAERDKAVKEVADARARERTSLRRQIEQAKAEAQRAESTGARQLAALRAELKAELGKAQKELEGARKPKEVVKRAIDEARLRWQKGRFEHHLARATGLVGTDPEQARELLEAADLFPPELRDERWLSAWQRCQRALFSLPGDYYAAAFSGNSRFLALARQRPPAEGAPPEHRVHVWDLASRAEVLTWAVPGEVKKLALSHDGARLAVQHQPALVNKELLRGLRALELETGEQVEAGWFKEGDELLGFAADGLNVLVASGRHSFYSSVYGSRTSRWARLVRWPADRPTAEDHVALVGEHLALSADGKEVWGLRTTDRSSTARIVRWDAVSGKELSAAEMKEAIGRVDELRFTQGGLLVVGPRGSGRWTVYRVSDGARLHQSPYEDCTCWAVTGGPYPRLALARGPGGRTELGLPSSPKWRRPRCWPGVGTRPPARWWHPLTA
jgi:hypothetical protein